MTTNMPGISDENTHEREMFAFVVSAIFSKISIGNLDHCRAAIRCSARSRRWREAGGPRPEKKRHETLSVADEVASGPVGPGRFTGGILDLLDGSPSATAGRRGARHRC